MESEILYKYLENTASDAEIKAVIDWLNADSAHQQELNRLDKVFCASAIYGDALQPAQPQPIVRRSIFLRPVVRYAMELAAMLAIGLGVAYVVTDHRIEAWTRRTTTLEIPAGHYMSMKLEDGTTVWLNSGTRLEYPLVFDRGERRVKVSGEAMFDVVHDSEHPFIVETFACDVEVLGTQFEVVADEATSDFSTSLLRGCVKVTNRLSPGDDCVLHPNERVHLVGNHLNREPIDDPDKFLWTQGMISIKGLNFRELMNRFEKSFGVKIVISRSDMPTINYNHGKIRTSDGVDSAMRLLQMASQFSYTKSEDGRTIVIE